jgi:Four helix bundle sensory module for signal transduction
MPSARVLFPHSSTKAPETSSERFFGGNAFHARESHPAAVSGLNLRKTRNVLLIGFGVLLILLILSGLNAIAVLSEMQTRNETILRDFLQEQQRLDKVRSAVYLSGTYLRDYLLEPDAEKAEQSRMALEGERAQAASLLANPGLLAASPGQEDMYAALKREIEEYWHTMDPALSWKPEQRHRQGYRFLRDEVFPRRSSTLNIADTIASVNQQR